MTSLHYFGLISIAVGSLLIGLTVVAPRTWYAWTPLRRRFLARWRLEIGVVGTGICIGTAAALVIVVLPQ